MTRLKHFPSHSCWLGQSCSPSPAKGTEPGTSKGDLPCFPFIQISTRVKLQSWDLTPASFARGLCSTSARLWHQNPSQNPSAVAADQRCTAQGDILGTASPSFSVPFPAAANPEVNSAAPGRTLSARIHHPQGGKGPSPPPQSRGVKSKAPRTVKCRPTALVSLPDVFCATYPLSSPEQSHTNTWFHCHHCQCLSCRTWH